MRRVKTGLSAAPHARGIELLPPVPCPRGSRARPVSAHTSGADLSGRCGRARRHPARDRDAPPPPLRQALPALRGDRREPASHHDRASSEASRAPTAKAETGAGELAVRGAGNVVELGSIAAFGFSPLWLLAGTSDIVHGSRVYLNTLVDELKKAGVVGAELDVHSVDDLLRALEEGSGGTARLIDIPPVELAGFAPRSPSPRERPDFPSPRSWPRSSPDFRKRRPPSAERSSRCRSASGSPSLRRAPSPASTSRPYREDLTLCPDEGFGAYARRVSPYARAIASHLARRARR